MFRKIGTSTRDTSKVYVMVSLGSLRTSLLAADRLPDELGQSRRFDRGWDTSGLPL